jgi:hypothetical protein
MRERRFGRLGWMVSEVGYGMWGIGGGEGGWTGADDEAGNIALDEAVRLGCNCFDTAWIYGRAASPSTTNRHRLAGQAGDIGGCDINESPGSARTFAGIQIRSSTMPGGATRYEICDETKQILIIMSSRYMLT